jgi:hypothetical protein
VVFGLALSWQSRSREGVPSAVQPAVAPADDGKGRTGLDSICISRPGVLCEHCIPAVAGERQDVGQIGARPSTRARLTGLVRWTVAE